MQEKNRICKHKYRDFKIKLNHNHNHNYLKINHQPKLIVNNNIIHINQNYNYKEVILIIINLKQFFHKLLDNNLQDKLLKEVKKV